MPETILYEVNNHAAWITLNRPESLNAITAEMNREIKQAVSKASKDPAVRCLVFTGAGRAFSSGQDLSDVDGEMDHGLVLREHYGPMIQEIMKCEKPIVAAVNGVAAGAGFSLALACDFRVASEKSSFLNAFIHVGLIPDSGNLFFLNRLIGPAKTLELSLFGEKIPSAFAYEMGIVNQVVSMEKWETGIQEYIEKIIKLPPKAVGLIKRSLSYAGTLPLNEYLLKEAENQRIAGLTEDHHEGVAAFLEKRKPIFYGK
ncbi:enoyl-CoA hydratase/isomerase family protein [Bacillus sp. 1P06AnD]|uniref:enoyl-CoA hydratase/isomerase family protein n=1 Tax=Bacillus sp. 1P06AnD TaxID=3132208 RepID=UPI0039A116E1